MSNPKTWLCPLCAQKRMTYGTTCDKRHVCENKPHITGQWYYDHYFNQDERDSAQSIGIAQISNETD